VKRNVLIVGNLDKHKYDKTTWYRMNYAVVRRDTKAQLFIDGDFHFPEEGQNEQNHPIKMSTSEMSFAGGKDFPTNFDPLLTDIPHNYQATFQPGT
jgi:hypothetical protein